jgi:hypothetical protein
MHPVFALEQADFVDQPAQFRESHYPAGLAKAILVSPLGVFSRLPDHLE